MFQSAISTPISMPPNPAILTTMDIFISLLVVGAVVLLVYILFFIYLAVTRKWR
jgi:hypothetical protein